MDMSALNVNSNQLIISGLFVALLIVSLPALYRGWLAKDSWLTLRRNAESGGEIEHQKYIMGWAVLTVEKNKLVRSGYLVLLVFSIANIILPFGLPLQSSTSMVKDKIYFGVSMFLVALLLIPIFFLITNHISSKKELENLNVIKAKLGVTGKLTLKMIEQADDGLLKR